MPKLKRSSPLRKLVEQTEGERLQGPGRRGHLGQDVDAVLVVLDHALKPADLTLDPTEPGEVLVLRLGVARHVDRLLVRRVRR